MSRHVALLNRLRAECGWSALTPSQQKACEALRSTLEVYGVVNLYGTHGSGKTFLCWALVKEPERLGATKVGYAPFAEQLPDCGDCAIGIVDNVPADREEVREAVRLCLARGYRKAVVVSVEAARDQISRSRLECDGRDVEHARNVLSSLGHHTELPDANNLWRLTNPAV